MARGIVQARMGSWPDAVTSYEKSLSVAPGSPLLKARLAFAYAHIGRKSDAEKIRSELTQQSKSGYVPPIAFAFIAAGLGESGPALDWLEKAAQEHCAMILEIPFTSEWDALRNEPKLAAIVQKAGL
jgi:Flp pilus assembly protein TadD